MSKSLRLMLSEIWQHLDQAAIPAPSHRNRTMTDWAARMERAKAMLEDAQNAAMDADSEMRQLAALRKLNETASAHYQVLANEIERLRGENRLILDALGMEKYRVRWRPAYGVEMPLSNVPVLAVVQERQKRLVVRATYIKAGQVEADLDYDQAEYDEEADTYWLNPGWYEHNLVEETHWQITDPVTHWAPLPGLPSSTVPLQLSSALLHTSAIAMPGRQTAMPPSKRQAGTLRAQAPTPQESGVTPSSMVLLQSSSTPLHSSGAPGRTDASASLQSSPSL